MHRKTEEFLNFLFWTADRLAHPTVRNLTESYESWAYRNGLLKQVSRLEQKQILERPIDADDRLYRLTNRGRLQALGGRDPEACWSRRWDGRWRLVLFDVPNVRQTHRLRLRRYLRERGFGCLQNSVWITPHPLTEESEILACGKVNVESLILLEARPCAGESDSEVVAGAWDFERINRRYARYLKVLDRRSPGAPKKEESVPAIFEWMADEREGWLDAVTNDPLLPEQLLPLGYLGLRAWQQRVAVLGETVRQLERM